MTIILFIVVWIMSYFFHFIIIGKLDYLGIGFQAMKTLKNFALKLKQRLGLQPQIDRYACLELIIVNRCMKLAERVVDDNVCDLSVAVMIKGCTDLQSADIEPKAS